MWKMLCYPIHSSSELFFGQIVELVLTVTTNRARRNKFGHLEPDAAPDVVQNSLGFGEYENLPPKEKGT